MDLFGSFHIVGEIFRTIIFIIPSIIVIVGCLAYFKIGNRLIGLLMIVGTSLSIAAWIISSGCTTLIRTKTIETVNYASVYTVSMGLSLIGSFMFAIGFRKLIKTIHSSGVNIDFPVEDI